MTFFEWSDKIRAKRESSLTCIVNFINCICMGNFDCLKVKHDERDQFQSDYFGSF